MSRREFIFENLKKVFRKYGFQPLETPSMENLSVLTGKYGEEGDRLIFKVLNSGKIAEKALRYDLTVPFARYAAMNHNVLNLPFKRYQVQPVWRADRPQKGRYREFYQCDCDVVGSEALITDAELIAIYDEAFTSLGFSSVRLLFNNRKILAGIAEVAGSMDLLTDICVAIDKLDKIGESKVREELANKSIGEAARDAIFKIITFEGSNAEKIDFLRKAFAASEVGLKGVDELEEVLSYLAYFELGCAEVVFDISLARGLEYYTGSIFEVKAVGVEYGSIGGGGRYDDLTGIFGVPNLPGVGISFGADRIYDVMDMLGLFPAQSLSSIKVVLINYGEEGFLESLKLLKELRKAGVSAEVYPEPAKFKKQFKYADKRQANFAVSIGSNEVEQGVVGIKNLQTGEQKVLPNTEALDFLISS
ncbi:UNVERIFIED_CONTAM: hypothetical protein GTU68_061074 [Idotea baltica]|nr:hypothetical protein [Idotea baltica]